MQYIEITGVSRPVSRLVQGTTMARTIGEQSFRLFDAALEMGINTFDTARVTGNEHVVGTWIADRGLRDRVNVITKGAHHDGARCRVTPKDITADIHDSLRNLSIDHIDVFLLHRDDPKFAVGPIVEILNEHQKAGKIGAFGGSNWTHGRVQEANLYAKSNGLVPFLVSSPNLSLVEQVQEPYVNCVSISGASGRDAREWYATSGVALMTWSALAGGFLSGRVTRNEINLPALMIERCRKCYSSETNFELLDRVRSVAIDRGATVPQIALAYVLSQPGKVAALVASENPVHIAENVAALDIMLTDPEIAWLEMRTSAQLPKT